MKAYLVDFENVKSHGLKGITQLEENDRVIIFYSVNSNTLSFEMHRQVMQSQAKVEYYNVKVGGKNALDFQLSSLLGFLIGSGSYTYVYIISGDKGFDRLHDFWAGDYIKHQEICVFRTSTIESAVNYTNYSARPNKSAEINKAISDISDEEAEENAKAMLFEHLSAESDDISESVKEPAESSDNLNNPKFEDISENVENAIEKIFAENLYESIDILPDTENMTNEEIQEGFEKYEGKTEHNFEQADEKFFEAPSEKAETESQKPRKLKGKSNEKKQTVKAEKTENSKEKKQSGTKGRPPKNSEQTKRADKNKECENLSPENSKPRPKGRPPKNPEQTKKADKSKEFENLSPENNQPQYDKLAELLNDICSMTEIKKVQALIQTMPTKQKLYHAAMSLMGQKKGLEVYSRIKKSYADIKAIKQ